MMDCLNPLWQPLATRGGLIRRFVLEDGGQDIIEYALIAGFVGIAGMLALRGIEAAVGTTYSSWIDPAAGTPSLWQPPEPTP